METWKELLHMVPDTPGWRIDWDTVEHSALQPFIHQMQNTPQDFHWHGEGDVWTHTRKVCEALIAMEDYRKLTRTKQEEVFVAALLHDIGKITCTKMEDGRWRSFHHGSTGAQMARQLLWTRYGLCGDSAMQNFRETVCLLIRYHTAPVHLLEQERPEHSLIRMAANGQLAADFSVALLCLLSLADVTGRIAKDVRSSAEMVELCAMQAQECGCLEGPLPFPTPHAQHAYLTGRMPVPGQPLYDDTWGPVLLMSGLPGTGKDTWITQHMKEWPMVSLDDIRREMGITPTQPQGPVLTAAREAARGYLRRREPFVWNATCLTPSIRAEQIRLFSDYGASVRIVFLETGWAEQLWRNRGRAAQVPEAVIHRMMGQLVLPERWEAQQVQWHCV